MTQTCERYATRVVRIASPESMMVSGRASVTSEPLRKARAGDDVGERDLDAPIMTSTQLKTLLAPPDKTKSQQTVLASLNSRFHSIDDLDGLDDDFHQAAIRHEQLQRDVRAPSLRLHGC